MVLVEDEGYKAQDPSCQSTAPMFGQRNAELVPVHDGWKGDQRKETWHISQQEQGSARGCGGGAWNRAVVEDMMIL